jgi:hypothetical protein
MQMFDYVAADGSEWEVSLVPPGAMPWATLSATPAAGGLPLTWNVSPEPDSALARVIGDLISRINERCQPCL